MLLPEGATSRSTAPPGASQGDQISLPGAEDGGGRQLTGGIAHDFNTSPIISGNLDLMRRHSSRGVRLVSIRRVAR